MTDPPDGRGAPTWEEPLPTLTGRAWAFGLRLTTDDMLPARYAAVDADAARQHVFADLDRTLAARLGQGDVVVAEEQMGSNAAGRALAALRAAGIAALAARRFEPTIERAAFAAGIVPVTLDAPAFIHTGDRVRIDLEDAKVVNLSSGDRAPIRNLTADRRDAIRAMLLDGRRTR
jgi:3-isopropylmalate dehydratase small subunit